MLAYTLKHIVELVPEALQHVKQASIEKDLPLDNRDSTLASALSLQYHMHVDGKPIDVFAMEKVAQAVELYGVGNVLNELTENMILSHRANIVADRFDPVAEYHTKSAGFEGELTGFHDVEGLAIAAEELYKEASDLGVEPPDSILRYSANAYLDKKAAVESLAARYQASGDVGFAKIAVALGRMITETIAPAAVQDICRTVSGMDKRAGLHVKGFDFYREALLTKEAEVTSSLRVRIAGSDVPYETLARLGKDTIGKYVGADVAKEMDGGPQNFKQVLETLPLDLQRIVLDLTKNA